MEEHKSERLEIKLVYVVGNRRAFNYSSLEHNFWSYNVRNGRIHYHFRRNSKKSLTRKYNTTCNIARYLFVSRAKWIPPKPSAPSHPVSLNSFLILRLVYRRDFPVSVTEIRTEPHVKYSLKRAGCSVTLLTWNEIQAGSFPREYILWTKHNFSFHNLKVVESSFMSACFRSCHALVLPFAGYRLVFSFLRENLVFWTKVYSVGGI